MKIQPMENGLQSRRFIATLLKCPYLLFDPNNMYSESEINREGTCPVKLSAVNYRPNVTSFTRLVANICRVKGVSFQGTPSI